MDATHRLLCLSALACALSAPALRAQTPLTTELFADGLSSPVYVTAPSGDGRLFVVEQRGTIRIVEDGVVRATPFLDLTDKVSPTGSETGLLGLAFNRNYAANGRFFVCYTRALTSDLVIAHYTANPPGSNTVLAETEQIVLVIDQQELTHNAGWIGFGPDRNLYVASGDGGGFCDQGLGHSPGGNAQDLTDNLRGKLLRLNVAADDFPTDPDRNYAIPADNPFVGLPGDDEIWAYGLRNPSRVSFDRETGDLYIADVGQDSHEEIDFQPAASAGGQNYGWPCMEGFGCSSESFCSTPCDCGGAVLEPPVHTYDHASPPPPTSFVCAVTGGYVYRGCAIPDLAGTYFFADVCGNAIWSFRMLDGQASGHLDRTAELDPPGSETITSIVGFGEDGEGELYLVEYAATNGKLFKIVPDAPPPYEDLGFALAGTGGVQPRLDVCGPLGSGDLAILRLRDAVPNALTLVVASFTLAPQPTSGGTLAPGLPTDLIFLLATDSTGSLLLPVPGGGGPAELYIQELVVDPGASQGVSFSNAIRALFQP